MSLMVSQHIGHLRSATVHHYQSAMLYYLAHYDFFTLLKHYGIEVSHFAHFIHLF